MYWVSRMLQRNSLETSEQIELRNFLVPNFSKLPCVIEILVRWQPTCGKYDDFASLDIISDHLDKSIASNIAKVFI